MIDHSLSMNVLLGCFIFYFAFDLSSRDVMYERFIRVFTYLLYKLYHMIRIL